jgi:hypothetical protein
MKLLLKIATFTLFLFIGGASLAASDHRHRKYMSSADTWPIKTEGFLSNGKIRDDTIRRSNFDATVSVDRNELFKGERSGGH